MGSSKTKNNSQAKLGLLSTILLVIGASIGAGIFYKNAEILKNVQYSIVLGMVSWFIAIIAVLAMAMTLVEICSANKAANDEGIIGWIKTFCHKYFYQASRNFMSYIYLPLNFFYMNYYGISSIQQAFNIPFQWWHVLLIALGISIWFIVVSGLSTTATNIQNWIITSVKFIPLIFTFLIGFILVGIDSGNLANSALPNTARINKNDPVWFNQLTPSLGLVASIPAIFFAFDGFYTTAGYQSQMKDPKKISTALGLGLAIVSFLNVGLSLSIMLCSENGTIEGIKWLRGKQWILQVLLVFISCGVFGIINAFAGYTAVYYDSLIKQKSIIGWKFFSKFSNPNNKLAGMLYDLMLGVFYVVTFTIIGNFAYIPLGYDNACLVHVRKLYSFADLVANWTSLFIFCFVVLAIAGCLLNRKTNKVKVDKTRLFVPCAWISIILISLAMLYVIISSFVDVGFAVNYFLNNKITINDLIGKIVTLTFLFLLVFLSALQPIISAIAERKKTKKCCCCASHHCRH